MNAFSNRFIFVAILIVSLFTLSFAARADIPPDELGLSDEEPLPPEQAFALSTSVTAADMVRAQWDIVNGYYLYREKFKFISNTPGISVQPAVFPKGKIKSDEFFGEVETYRGKIAVDIPIVRTGDATTLDLTIVSQGCADLGLCYPPQKQQVSLNLPALPATVPETAAPEPEENKSASPLSALKRLGDSLGLSSNEEEFLPGDQVFIFSAEAENGNLIKARWDILKGYYLYRDKFKFELQNADGVTIGDITMPSGQEKVDESFGRMTVYHNQVEVLLPLTRTKFDPAEVTLVAKFQGCAERGFCYPPMTQSTLISLPAGKPTAPVASGGGAMGGGPVADEPVSEQDQLAEMIKSGNFILTLLIFFGSGLLLAFTPCVFPMIPILSSIIAGQGDSITTRKAFTMSLIYVLAMALTYTVAGVIAGTSGSNLQAAFQNPWILSTFALVFVALSFSMFGFYEIQMPTAIQSKLTEISNRQQGGTLTGVAIMGFLSALIVGPCVAAPLMGALIYIGQTGDPVLGGAALFALSLGMGAPLLVIGTAAGKLLPKAGGWMDAVKAVFGVLLLAVAVWMLERILPAEVSMLLWAALLIVSAIYMGAVESIPQGASGWRKLWKGIGLIGLIYGALLLVGVAGGARDPLQPLHGIMFTGGGGAAQSGVAHQGLQFKQIKGLEGLNRELAAAKAAGKVTMLDFYADWCVSCKEMEKYTFSDPNVQQALQDVVLLQADVTPNDDQDQALLKNFGLIGPPSLLFFDRNGTEKRNFRLVGFLKPEKFVAHVKTLKQ